MSRTARLAAVAAAFAALCAAAVTTTSAPAPAEDSRISAASINWDTPPADADPSINWD
ncbi:MULTISPECIES: hypothetical protein [unclassified Streptomyces]|uniref:hypothetical protein n=1 Tax=unclassified Streptomyces TaxID=2593676 RepID=UPI000AC48D0C|nr:MULTISPECIES: hypothetical protein [unclassified Streptomyces]